MTQVMRKRAYGAFLGVLCGDAAGATLEFHRGEITSEMVSKAMRMPGGGLFRVGPGQITDDSELALSLSRAITQSDRSDDDALLEATARSYAAWCDTRPYDIGNTCAAAFETDPTSKEEPFAPAMMQRAQRFSMASEANGALMRIVPMALLTWNNPEERIVLLAKRDALLSHPSVVCQDCNAVYCLLLVYLLHHPGDFSGAIAHGERFVLAHVSSVARDWFLQESLQELASIDCSRQIGHVRWAFVLAIHFLRRNESYERAIHATLLKGGDTDTNAAIVGGLMGALHGADAIPEYMSAPVLAFDCSNPIKGRQRPAAYKSDQIAALTSQLLGHVDGA